MAAQEGNYWEAITKIAKAQEAKGLAHYGERLEDNRHLNSVIEINRNTQEELTDALMYTEHLNTCYKRNLAWLYAAIIHDMDGIVTGRQAKIEIRKAVKDRIRSLGGEL